MGVYHKLVNSIRKKLVSPNDPTLKERNAGCVKIHCKECEGGYIGETGRAFGTRFKEHSNISRASKGTFP